jgi:hypothetical protein
MRPDAEVSRTTRKLRMLRTLICDDSYERAAQASGALRIAGVDEVGRGALFGPVVAAAVILPPGCHAAVLQAGGLRDSKQLEAQDRERLAAIVRDCAVAIAIGVNPTLLSPGGNLSYESCWPKASPVATQLCLTARETTIVRCRQ